MLKFMKQKAPLKIAKIELILRTDILYTNTKDQLSRDCVANQRNNNNHQ